MTDQPKNGEICSIQPSDNGPLLVRGPVKLIDQSGNEFDLPARNIALCRCGASGNKPFCDGSHSRVEFRSVIRAEPVLEPASSDNA